MICILYLAVLASCRKPQAETVVMPPVEKTCYESAQADKNECKSNPRMGLPGGVSFGMLSRKNYSAEYSTRHSHRAMSWEIIKVRTSDSTQVGYAIGNWKITLQVEGHDTTLYGKCLSIWKQEPDGSWKNVREVNAMYPV